MSNFLNSSCAYLTSEGSRPDKVIMNMVVHSTGLEVMVFMLDGSVGSQ